MLIKTAIPIVDSIEIAVLSSLKEDKGWTANSYSTKSIDENATIVVQSMLKIVVTLNAKNCSLT